jgi:hypothetical protein
MAGSDEIMPVSRNLFKYLAILSKKNFTEPLLTGLIPDANFFLEVGIYFPIVLPLQGFINQCFQTSAIAHLVLPHRLLIQVILMNYELVRQHIKGDAREIHFKKTGCFIGSITDKSFITPSWKMDEGLQQQT